MPETKTNVAERSPEAPRFTPEQAETLRRLEALAPDVLAAVEAKDLARAKPLFNERGAIARAALSALGLDDAGDLAFARALIDQSAAVEQAVVNAIEQYGKTMTPPGAGRAPLPEMLDAYERVAGFAGFYSLHLGSVFNENAGGKYVALMGRYRHNLGYDLLLTGGAPRDDSAASVAFIERAPGLAASLLDQAHGLSNRFDLADAFRKKLLEQLVDRGEIDAFADMSAEILEKDIPPRVRTALFDVWCQVGRPEVVVVRRRFAAEWAAATAFQKRLFFGGVRQRLTSRLTIASFVPALSEMMDEGVLKREDIPDFARKALIEDFISSHGAASLDMDKLGELWRKFEFSEKEKDEIFEQLARGTTQGNGFVELAEQVGLPSREVVRKAYHALIARAGIFDLRKLQELSRVPFDFTYEEVTAAYAAILQMMSSSHIKGALIRELRKLIPDHVAPAEVLQEWYRKKLASDAQNIREIVEATGVRLTPEAVAQAYESVVLRSGVDRYTGRYSTGLIVEIFHETNERPSDAVLSAHQEECLKRGDYDVVRQLRNLFGEVPPVSSEMLQTTYVKLVQGGDGEQLRRLFEAFPDFKGAVPEEAKATGALSIFKLGVRRDVAERLGAFQVFVGALDPAVIQEGYAVLVGSRRHDIIPSVARLTGVEPDWPTIGRSFPLTDIRQVASLGETGDVELQKLRDHIPWHPAIRRLRKIQGFVEHAEHDPWRKELQPLLDVLVQNLSVSEQSPEDGDLFADFVQEFGALNMPRLCVVFLAFKQHPQLDGVSPDLANWFSEATGKNVVRLRNGEAGINELRRFKRRVQEELLADKIPAGADTVLGYEIINALRTTTRWGSQGQMKDLIQTWQTTYNVATNEGHPEWVTVPEGYAERRVELANAAVAVENDPTMQRAIGAILDSPEVKRADGEIKRLMQVESGWGVARFLQWFIETKEEIIRELYEKKEKAQSRLADAPERAKKGIEMSMQQIKGAAGALEAITFDGHPTRAEYGAVLETVVALHHPDVEPLIRLLASRHLAMTLPDTGWAEAYRQLSSPFIDREARVPLAADFLLQFMKEHYLHPLQEEHQTYHEPFSPEVRDKLELLWGLKKKDQAGMRIIAAAEEMRKIREGAVRGTGKTESVAFVPVRGLLRVFAGDVGDACYTSRHEELARGDYPEITAVMMVTNRGEAQERLAGSALLVQTSTLDGKKALVLRANNPRENLLGKVDADALVQATVDYAIEVATARGIDVVGVCMDGVSQSATNRAKVFEYYKKQFTGRDRLNLANTPDTNFNGYDITQNTVAAVWERTPPLE